MDGSSETRTRASLLIARRLGLTFPASRLIDLDNGLIRAAREWAEGDVAALVERLEHAAAEAPEWALLIRYVTVGETCFFRYPDSFRTLEERVILPLIAERRAAGNRTLRLWSAGCATGEEAYSLAILLRRLLPDIADWTVAVIATDLNPACIEAARRGVYRPWALRELSPAWRNQYFLPQGVAEFSVAAEVRRLVTLERHNLAAEDYPSLAVGLHGMDVILCRNVLMYLTPEVQRKVARRLCRALLPGGWLVTTPAEGQPELFHPLHAAQLPGGAFMHAATARAVESEMPAVPAWTLPEPPPEIAPPAMVVPPAAAAVPEKASLDRAAALADRGALAAARAECEAVVAADRTDPEAYRLLAAICEEMDDAAAAIAALRAVIFLLPDSPSSHFLLGRLLLREGAREEARRAMQTALRLLRARPGEALLPEVAGLSGRRLAETVAAQLAALERGARSPA